MRNTAARVVADLVSAGLVDATRSHDAETVVSRALHEIPVQRAVGEPVGKPQQRSRTLLVEIAGYLGGALVVASMGLFLAQYWEDFSETTQVVTLAVIAALLAAAGLVVSRVGGGYAELRAGRDEVRRRLASALLTAAALGAALAVGQQVSHLQTEEFSDWPVLWGSVTMLVLAGAAYAYAPSALGQVAMVGALFNGVMTGWTLADERQTSSLWPGLTLLACGLVWLVVAEAGLFREPVVGRALGVALALFGAQMPMFEGDYANLAYALTAVVAVAGFGMYLRSVQWPYLVAGVLGITLVVPEAVIDWTGGELGAAFGVLIAGLTLLGASLVGFRLRQEATEEERAQTPADSEPQDEVKHPAAH